MISDETEDSTDKKHNFCVNVQHRRKGWFYFRPLSQPWKNHRTPFFSLFPSIIILISAQFSRQGHRCGIWMGPVGKTERRNLNSGLSALSTSGVSLRRSLRAVVTLTNHTLWWEFSHVLPHITGQMHGGKQQLHYGGSNKWRESWLLFIFFRCSSYCLHVCVYICVCVCVPGFGKC